MNSYCLSRAFSNLQLQSVRRYAFKSDLKIKWVRPEKISCIEPEKSGDAGKLPAVKLEEYVGSFQKSKELQSSEPVVQSLFRLSNNRNLDTSNYYRELMIKEVQRHPLDYGSMEAKVAKMTATIRRFQVHMKEFPRDTRIKVALKEMIDKRKKFLKFLRRWDYARFEWMLEKLDLIYKPPPNNFHWITRKESLQKLTDLHCENIKNTRLENYRKQLEMQQIPVLEDIISKMEFVRSEQIEGKMPVTVTVELIDQMKSQLEGLKLKKEAKNKSSDNNNNEEN